MAGRAAGTVHHGRGLVRPSEAYQTPLFPTPRPAEVRRGRPVPGSGVRTLPICLTSLTIHHPTHCAQLPCVNCQCELFWGPVASSFLCLCP